MTPEEFVDAIKIVVRDGGVHGSLETLRGPSGRKPDQSLARLSSWFGSRRPEDREMIQKAVELTADMTAYVFLSVLDNIATIEPAGPKGELELFWQKGNARVLLNGPKGEQLTSIYKS